MTIKNSNKSAQKKTQTFKRKAFMFAVNFMPIRLLVKHRRAVSAVVSNLILVAAVIVIGLVALSYARSTSISYQTQYGQNVNSDIDKLKETVAFEYVTYKAGEGKLYVYFMNAGSIGNLNIKTALLSNSSWSSTVQDPQTKYLNGTLTSDFGVAEEGYLALSFPGLTSGSYTVKLTTGRDSSFASDFMV